MSTKTNERELSSKIATWFQEHIQRNSFPFTSAGNEAGIKGEGATKFGDVFLWKNREANQVFTLIELKPPFGQKENLKVLEEKAQRLKLRFVYTWDFRNLNVYELKNGKLIAAGIEHTPVLEKLEDWLRGDVQANIKSYIHRFCLEFIRFEETGKFSKFLPDKVYFVNLIREFVKSILPHFEQHIRTALTDKVKKAAIDEYVVKQGIAYSSDQDFIRLVAGQRVYGLATKIIFYQTIRRFFDDLPDLIQPDADLTASIQSAFEQAREKDWQAVFEAGPIEALGIPESSYNLFQDFLIELKVYHFGQLPEDVIGEVFQEIIDPEQRHTLGQYFTMEALVDFVIALVVNDPNGIYCDPTCGSGTFLIRLYDRLKYLSPGKTHKQLLDQIWGFDIGSFPAELSTINLFRQDASNFENFPRVRTTNIFDVHRGMEFDFPPPNSGKHYIKISTPLPPIDAFVGNFPFIRQELIEKKDQGFKKGLTKLLAYEYLESYPVLFVQKNGIASAANALAENATQYNHKQNIDHWVEKGDLELRLSGKADIYAYIYIHLTTLLAAKGSFSIITSNSWLDTEYGHILKQFFLDHFCIKAIVASWAEPWFEDAAVNCVVTVLERETNPQKRAENKVKFVKLKLGMAQMAEYGTELWESRKRWSKIDGWIRGIYAVDHFDNKKRGFNTVNENISGFEDEFIKVRSVKQDFLL
ncbi:MAG TPA: N-6 DNA methylase, partial [Catalimonadaceae bacterium]|nr:N-6 DNA methylase [Catalimonadaceae bacterium]